MITGTNYRYGNSGNKSNMRSNEEAALECKSSKTTKYMKHELEFHSIMLGMNKVLYNE